MNSELLTGLVVFCRVTLITPGPNNLMLMASGLNFGMRRSGPHMLGVYKLDGKTLTFCVAESDKPADRPKDVTATGDRIMTMVLEKAAEPKDKK